MTVAIAILILLLAAGAWVLGVLLRYYRVRAVREVKPVCVDYIGRAELGPYYLSLAHKLSDRGREVNAAGAVVVRDASGAERLHPVGTVHRALAHHELFVQTGDAGARATFLAVAAALAQGAVRRSDGAAVWPYWIGNYPGQRLPWLSAMAQGQAIAVFCRAFEAAREPEYLELARAALKPFQQEIPAGGVRATDARRGVFYEEYAFAEEGRQHHTLNGMIAGLFGVHDLWKLTGDAAARSVFDAGVATLRANLAAYHFPFCSAYDLRHEHGEPALFSPVYNSVHVSHLRVLARLTGDAYFEGFADVWDTTLRDRWNRLRLTLWYLRWSLHKAGQRCVAGAAGPWSRRAPAPAR